MRPLNFIKELKMGKDIEFVTGQHCETTATGTLLKNLEIDLSEPMLFGLGQGLGFIYWEMKIMDFPFLGGRTKPELITKTIAKNLNLKLDVKETSSTQKAWENVKILIDKNIPVGLKLDCYHLDYFKEKFHFAAHYVAMYGYDDQFAYLVDTAPTGGKVKTSLKSLELARNPKGPMSSKNLSYTIKKSTSTAQLKNIIPKAIKENAKDYLNPPIQNIGYKGVGKASQALKKWYVKSKKPEEYLKIIAMLMEKAGTGGALFRNMYRDFLKESFKIVPSQELYEGHRRFSEIAEMWSTVARLFERADGNSLNEACDILSEISEKEKEAMEILLKNKAH
jgi:hypothetical protein